MGLICCDVFWVFSHTVYFTNTYIDYRYTYRYEELRYIYR